MWTHLQIKVGKSKDSSIKLSFPLLFFLAVLTLSIIGYKNGFQIEQLQHNSSELQHQIVELERKLPSFSPSEEVALLRNQLESLRKYSQQVDDTLQTHIDHLSSTQSEKFYLIETRLLSFANLKEVDSLRNQLESFRTNSKQVDDELQIQIDNLSSAQSEKFVKLDTQLLLFAHSEDVDLLRNQLEQHKIDSKKVDNELQIQIHDLSSTQSEKFVELDTRLLLFAHSDEVDLLRNQLGSLRTDSKKVDDELQIQIENLSTIQSEKFVQLDTRLLSFTHSEDVVQLRNQLESQITFSQNGLQIQIDNLSFSQSGASVEFKDKFEGINVSISQLNNTYSSKVNDLIIQDNLLSSLIQEIKKNSDQVPDIKISTNNLTSQLQLYYNELNDMENNSTLIHTQLTNTQISQQTGIDELQSESSVQKNSIDQISAKIYAETFNLIEFFGPFHSTQHEQQILSRTSDYEIFKTTESTKIEIKDKAIVTLIATGHSRCQNWDAKITFLIDRKVALPLTDKGDYYGMGYINTGAFTQLSLTQEFIVEKGIHEFTLGIAYVSGIIDIHAISILIKVTYLT